MEDLADVVEQLTHRLAIQLTNSMRPLIEEAVDQAIPTPASQPVAKNPTGGFVATVEEIEHPTPTLALLQLRLPDNSGFQFMAGQFTMVHGQSSEGPRKRAYSIASPPSWLPRLDLAVSLVNDAGESGWLCERRVGDQVTLERARGKFTFKPAGRPVVMLATGTGVAPFRSMLYDQWDQGHQPEAWLFVGASHVAGLPYHEELKVLDDGHPGFEYIPAVSRPAKPWEGVTGHIQAPFLARFEGRTDFDAYLCGSPAMVRDTFDLLRRRGVPHEQVFQERF